MYTVVIDKLEHNTKYKTWKADPYHYCLHFLLERYVRWLDRGERTGDVMAESRGKREDERLKKSFEHLYETGSEYVTSEAFRRLTSRQLKVKSKANNIAGLQLADLVAHPSYRSMLADRPGERPLAPFGRKIAEILEESKYDRDDEGKIDGWGRKWLP